MNNKVTKALTGLSVAGLILVTAQTVAYASSTEQSQPLLTTNNKTNSTNQIRSSIIASNSDNLSNLLGAAN